MPIYNHYYQQNRSQIQHFLWFIFQRERHQPHPLSEVSVVKKVHSSSTIILAIVLAVVMGLQCCLPVFFCTLPGLILAIKVCWTMIVCTNTFYLSGFTLPFSLWSTLHRPLCPPFLYCFMLWNLIEIRVSKCWGNFC